MKTQLSFFIHQSILHYAGMAQPIIQNDVLTARINENFGACVVVLEPKLCYLMQIYN